ESSLYTDDKNSKKSGYKKFRSLEHEEKKSLLMVIESQDESLYKLFKIKTAKDFWADLSSLINEDIFRKLQGNRTEIEKILRDLLKIKKLRYCIKKIEEGDIKYQKINYKEIGGREVLHRNRIGHDTLILYSHRIVNKYDILKKIILDSYPAVFIDEYQDTHSQVISLFDELLSYSKKNKLSFTLSLFGDPVQSIYSNNLNNREIKNKIEIVEKNINRRSHKQIIDCISKIRGLHQEINQVSIYSDKKDGTVSYYIANKSEVEPKIVIDNKISEYKDKWGISSKNKLSCMVLKNKNLSELCNFEDYYSIIEKTYQDKTSLVRFDSVNEELLSKDLTRLGSLPIAIFNIVKPLYFLTHCRQRPLTDIFSSESLESNSLENVIACLDDLRESKYQNIKSYVEDIIIKSNKESDLYSLYKNLN
ncbi:UvrD-helicase domain-containing protein, partial [Photobacterium swingsii]